MSDEMKTTVRVDTVSDTAGIQKAEHALTRAEERVKRLQLAAERAAKSDANNVAKIEQANKRLAQAEEALGQRRQKLADAREGAQERLAQGARRIALEERKADDAKAIRQRKLDQDADKINAEKADRQRKLDLTEKKTDAERADRQTRLAQNQTRIERDAEREARVRQNKADQANRRRQAALSQQERQQGQLDASAQRTQSVYERINATLGFKGVIERQQGRAALNDFHARTKASQDLYHSQLQTFSGLTAEDQRARMRARDAYTLAIAEARSSFQTKMAYARALQSSHMRDIREQEAAHRRLQEQVSRGYGQMRSGLGQALQAGRTPALYGAAATGALAAAGVKGISNRSDVDAAETNLRIFGDNDGKRFTQDDVVRIRKEWLDREALETANTPASALRAFTEINKAGIRNPRENTGLLLRATTGLELGREDTTKLMGLVDRNLGAKSSPERMHSVFDAIAVAAREDPSQAPEIVEGMKRGFGALSRGNMSPEQLASLVSGGQSVGIQPGKAGTFIDALTQELAEGQYARGQRKKDLNKAAQMLGFGSGKNMARQSATDSYGTIIKLFERLERLTPEMRSKATAFISQRQWSGEDLQMVQGLPGMKKTYAEIQKDLGKNKGERFIDVAFEEKIKSWDKQWERTKAVFSRFWESFGLGFDDVFTQINTFFYESAKGFDWSRISDTVRGAMSGFLQGLGFKDIRTLLTSAFGGVGQGDVVGQVRAFATGLGSGLRSIFDAVKGLMGAFAGGSQDPETIGRLTGRILGLSAALVVISPVVGVLGAITGVVTGIAGAVRMFAAIPGVIAGAGASGAGSGAAAAGGAIAGMARTLLGGLGLGIVAAIGSYRGEIATLLGAPQIGQMIWDGIKTMLTDVYAFLRKQLSLKGIVNGLKTVGSEFVPAPIENWLNGDGSQTGPRRDVSPEGTQRVIDDSRRQIEELRQRIEPNTKAIEDNTRALIEKQSYDGSGSIGGLVRNASLGSGDVQSMGARFQLAALTSTGALTTGTIRDQILGGTVPGGGGGSGTSHGGGGGYVPGGGGAVLYGNTPGKAFGVPGVGSRFGVGDTFAPQSNRGQVPDYGEQYGPHFGRIAPNGYSPGRRASNGLSDIGDGIIGTPFGQRGSGRIGASDGSPIAAFRGSQTFDGLAPRITSDLQRDFGLSKEEASAVLGNLGHESGGFRHMQEINPRGGGRGGYGWAQWTGPRRRAFEGYVAERGLDPRSYEANYGFLRHELETSHRSAIGAVKRAQGLEGKTAAFENVFERAGVKAYRSRFKFARRAMGLPDGAADGTGPVKGAPDRPSLSDRAREALGGKPGTFTRGQDIGDAMRGTPFGQHDAESLARQSPAERLADQAPPRPAASGGGMGRGGPAVHAPITIHNNGDAEHTANQVQRRIQDTQNYLTQDIAFEAV